VLSRFKKSGPIFEERLKYRNDFPGINCESCEEAYEEGEILELPCDQCPMVLFGEPDHRSRLTYRVVEYLNATPAIEHGVPWELICRMAGVPNLDTLREVWMRLGIMKRVMDEYDKLTQETAPDQAEDDE
jgi:hypothetical protein